jgi:hypothetical protein
VTLKPEAIQYSIWGRGFNRTHKFMINMPPTSTK